MHLVKKRDLTYAFSTSGLRKNIVVSCLYFSLYNKVVIFVIIYFSWLPPSMCPQVTSSTLGELPPQCLLGWLWPGKACPLPKDIPCLIITCPETLEILARQGTKEKLEYKCLNTMCKSNYFALFPKEISSEICIGWLPLLTFHL